MQEFPHHYEASASGKATDAVNLSSENLPQIASAAPLQFGGPGDKWSPEHLLTATVADCFILTFRAVARASKLEWSDLDVSAVGILDRVERQMKFTEFKMSARLTVPAGTDPDKATRAMEKSEEACMITNSLTATVHLETEVIVEA